MARSYVKGILKFKSLDENKKAENVSMPNLVENASAEDIKSVRDAIATLVEHRDPGDRGLQRQLVGLLSRAVN